MKHSRRPTLTVGALALGATFALVTACSSGGDGEPVPTPTPAPATVVPGAEQRARVGGILTIDGEPLQTDFLGARVIRDGLVTACQSAIPPVDAGQYQIEVASDAEVRGCGAPGAEIMLWAYVNGIFVFSNETAPWPDDGAATTFDATFSMVTPLGAGGRVTEMKGHLFDGEGNSLPGGTVVEAYVGEALCGVTSLPFGDATEGYYTLFVAGPEAVSACAEGAPLTFRVDGKPAAGTAVNDLSRVPDRADVDLRLE